MRTISVRIESAAPRPPELLLWRDELIKLGSDCDCRTYADLEIKTKKKSSLHFLFYIPSSHFFSFHNFFRRRMSTLFPSSFSIGTHQCKGKAVPLQSWSGPEGSRKLRFQDFMTSQDGGKVISLTHRPSLPTGNATGTHFC